MTRTDASRHLFVYGTLVVPQCLNTVLGHRHPGERLAARLRGFARITTITYPYPFILEADGSSVDGVLVMDLSPYDMQVLDRYEEVESGVYRRDRVQVEAWSCGPNPVHLEADTYVAGPSLRATASTAH